MLQNLKNLKTNYFQHILYLPLLGLLLIRRIVDHQLNYSQIPKGIYPVCAVFYGGIQAGFMVHKALQFLETDG